MAAGEVLGEIWAVAGGVGPVDVRVFVRGVTNYRYTLTDSPQRILSGGVPLSEMVIQNLGTISIELGNDRALVYGQGLRVPANSLLSGGGIVPGSPGFGVLEQFARAALPAAGNTGRLVELTDYDKSLWVDDGAQWFSIGGEIINVKARGARGDNVADDLASIDAAIAAAFVGGGGTVYFPPGTYRITATIDLTSDVRVLGAGRLAAQIAPSAETFAAFTATGPCIRWSLEHLVINFGTATGLTPSANPAAIGVQLLFGAGVPPYMFEIAFVQIFYSFNALSSLTTCRAFMFSLRHVYSASNGGYAYVVKPTQGCTTILFQNVYAAHGVQGGFDLFGIDGLTMLSCAVDDMAPTVGDVNVISSCRFTIDGFQAEANTTVSTGFGAVLLITNSFGTLNAYRSVGNLLQTDVADEAYSLRVSSTSRVVIIGPSNVSDTSNGGGTSFGIVASTSNTSCVVHASAVIAAAGTATNFGVYVANGMIELHDGAWIDFTPTVTQNGARTITVNYCRYKRIGKTAFVDAEIVITNAGTAGWGITLGAIPSSIAPRETAGLTDIIGRFIYSDAGVYYVGVAQAASASTVGFVRGGNVDTTTMGAAGGGNFATANGDVLAVNLQYEVA